MMCSARRLASRRRTSLTNPLALLSLIAHQRKRLLKIGRSQGCTSVKCRTSGHVTNSPCSQAAGALEARNSMPLRSPHPAGRTGSGCGPLLGSAGCRLLSSPPRPGLKASSRQSDARQAIFTCFPRGCALPLLSSCTCQLGSRHQ